MTRFAIAFAALLAAGCASGPGAAPAPAIRTTSFADAAGVRTIQLSTHLAASPLQAYDALATSAGWKTWAVPSAFGEPRVGGLMETSYDRAAKAGDPGNIVQEFLALLPERMVIFHTKRAPPGFPNADLYYRTLTIVDLTPEGDGVRLTLSHTGFGPEPGFDTLYKFFSQGDAQTLEQLRKRFETGPVDWSKAR